MPTTRLQSAKSCLINKNGSYTIEWTHNGYRAPVQLRNGQFEVFGKKYVLNDTSPESFDWDAKKKIRQEVVSCNARTITWKVNTSPPQVILWHK